MKRFDIDPKGFFKILGSSSHSQAAEMTLEPGGKTGGPGNMHADSNQWLYVVSGQGEATVNGRKVKLKLGRLLLIEAGETHEIINTGKTKLKTFSIYSPPEY